MLSQQANPYTSNFFLSVLFVPFCLILSLSKLMTETAMENQNATDKLKQRLLTPFVVILYSKDTSILQTRLVSFK